MKLKYIIVIASIAVTAMATEKVLTWDDTEPFPFGGDFLADGSVPMTGDLNMGGQSITNGNNITITNVFTAKDIVVTNVAISGGSPTNGAVFVATNNAGQGTWDAPSCIYAVRTNDQVIAASTPTDVIFNKVYDDISGEYNAATGVFTAETKGIYIISTMVTWKDTDANTVYYVTISVSSGESPNDRYHSSVANTLCPRAFSATVNIPAGTTISVELYHAGEETILGLNTSDATYLSITKTRSLH